MAEKVTIVELDINTDALIKSATKSKEAIEQLKNEQKKLREEGKQTSEQYVKNEVALKKLNTEYNRQKNVLLQLQNENLKLQKTEIAINNAVDKNINTIKSARENNKQLLKIRNELNLETEAGQKALQNINKKLDQNNQFIKKNVSAYEKQKINIGNYKSALKGATGAMRTFGLALKALGIGLIIGAVTKLSEAFGRNQKIMNTVNTIFNAIGIVFDKVVGSVVDAFEAVNKATGGFDALGRVIKNIMTIALTPIQVSFHGIKAAIIGAQLLWENSFLGGKDANRIKELEGKLQTTKDKIKELGQEAVMAGKNIVDDFGEALNEVGTLASTTVNAVAKSVSSINLKEVVKDARELTSIRNNIEALIISQEGLVQKYEREAEILRQRRDDERNSIAERLELNDALGKKLEEQAQAELKLIGLRIGAAQKEASLNKGNIELQNEVLRLQNEQLEVENRIETQRSEKLANDNALRNEELARIREFEAMKKELRDEIELANAESEQEKEILKAEKDLEKHLAELEQIELNEAEKNELMKLIKEAHLIEVQELEDRFLAEKHKKETDAAKKELALKKSTNKEILDGAINLFGQQSKLGQALIAIKGINAARETLIDLGILKNKIAINTSKAQADIATGKAATSQVGFPQNVPLLIAFAAQVGGIISAIKGAIRGANVAVPSFNTGGQVKGRNLLGIPTQKGGDNVLITAKRGEVILNDEQQRRAGGAAFFRSIGVPNFNTGGVIGGINSSSLAPSKFSFNTKSFASEVANVLSDRVNDIKIVAIENDITSAQGLQAEIIEGANI